MKKFVISSLLAVSCVAQADESQWLYITGHTGDGVNFHYDALKGSGVFSKNTAGAPIYVVTFRDVNALTNTTTYEKEYVLISDCNANQGRLVATNLSGEFLYTTEYILAGSRVGDLKAAAICGSVKFEMDRAKGLSIPS